MSGRGPTIKAAGYSGKRLFAAASVGAESLVRGVVRARSRTRLYPGRTASARRWRSPPARSYRDRMRLIDTPAGADQEPRTPEQVEAEALDAYSTVVTRVAELLSPAVANLRVS